MVSHYNTDPLWSTTVGNGYYPSLKSTWAPIRILPARRLIVRLFLPVYQSFKSEMTTPLADRRHGPFFMDMDKKISIWFCLTVNFVCHLIVHDYLCYVYSEPGFNSKLFLQPVHCDKRGLAQSLAHYCSSRLNFTTTQVSVRFDPNSFVRITVLSFLSLF